MSTTAALESDEVDRMIAEAARRVNRSRRRFWFVVSAVAVTIIVSAIGAYVMRARAVWLTAPDGENMMLAIDGHRVRVPAGKSVGIALRPGAHEIHVTGVTGARSSIDVPFFGFSKTFAPVTDEQCFIDASVSGMYGENPSPPNVFRISKPGETVSSGIFSEDHVVGDICEIPTTRKIMSGVHVVQPIRCSEAPKTRDEAASFLLRQWSRC
jgi:hypothetical protein